MRWILFRGKQVNNGDWVFGVPYTVKDESSFIIDNCRTLDFTDDDTDFQGHKVTPETIGQFTGLFDKNGNKIFEGDYLHTAGYCCEVKFIDGMFCSVYNHPEDGETLPIVDLSTERFEIIGNIHDHATL